MEQLKVLSFLEEKKDFLFPNTKYSDMDVMNVLLSAPDSFEMVMRGIPFRKTSTVKALSVILMDRFYLGDRKKGMLKYLTLGAFGVWWIMDIKSAKDRCRAYNCQKLMDALNDPSVVSEMVNTDNRINKAITIGKQFAPVVKEIGKGAMELRDGMFVDPPQ